MENSSPVDLTVSTVWHDQAAKPGPEARCTALLAVADDDGFVFLLPGIFCWDGAAWAPEGDDTPDLRHTEFWWTLESDILAGLRRAGHV